MPIPYVLGMLRITNLLIAIFVLLYAYMFVNKTSKRSERKPWDYLYFAAFIFLLYQIFSIVAFFGNIQYGVVDHNTVNIFVEFIFSGLVLLAFVSQHDLIIQSPLILISRRIEKKEK